jgi:hypothetical protein
MAFDLLLCGVAGGGRSVARALIKRTLVWISLSMSPLALRAAYCCFGQ